MLKKRLKRSNKRNHTYRPVIQNFAPTKKKKGRDVHQTTVTEIYPIKTFSL